ncbi:serine/threonine-protein kinase fused isoform X4 [Anthonomus grandis grandis]|uniref:serine/threonine-protein kinase fused isoform X4 n=1 Tax=Anthonomus grandis grandis TaxID=2921223 RepID=UPI002166709C|nr:serine/threonine-protein kinase fused isoform X4 [Anthonomus grandis grandis]
MEKYEVIGTLGEGSFGRVYKAKELSSSNFVALKVISKRGRSSKELKGFRRECEIQRELHHPNVIQMLDSFETENEIVVITEFAPKELTDVLSKQGYLTEDKVKQIVWDLVSALYYLHSNRVLHRDLKPQNILLDLKNRAKLCDFGFARNMSTGTHVLTSIKGTPLYMAPELIDELPYDYNADLWSLGCIIYELLMGTPPFCTNSILHLIRKIKTEQIKWPTFLSPECTSFLKGLLQKNPSKRLTWNQILNHSFVKGHILISKTTGPMPLTISLSASAQEAKEQQRKDSINNKHTNKGAIPRTAKKSVEVPENEKHSREKVKEEKATLSNNKNNSLDTGQNPTGAIPKKPLTSQEQISSKEKPLEVFTEGKSHRDENGNVNEEIKKCDEVKDVGKCLKEKLNFIEDSHPIEPEEWIVFLQNSIKEVYLEVKLLPNLIYATKLLLRTRKHLSSSESSNSSSEGVIAPSRNDFTCKSLNEFDSDELQALEHILMLACHLVHLEDEFVSQFCDAVVVLNMFGSINLLLGLVKRKPRIPMDIISILTQILRNLPENVEIVEKIALHHTDSGSELHLGEFLRNSDASIKERTCHFILLMGKYFSHDTLEKIWSLEIQDTLEALMFDSVEHVRNMELPHTTLWQFDIGLMNTFQGCGLAGVVQLNDPTTRFLPLT